MCDTDQRANVFIYNTYYSIHGLPGYIYIAVFIQMSGFKNPFLDRTLDVYIGVLHLGKGVTEL